MLGILIGAGVLALPVLWAGARWLYDVRLEAGEVRELLLQIGELPDDVEAFNADQAEEAFSILERFQQLPAASPLDYPQVHRLEERRDVLMKIRERVSTEGTAPRGHHATEKERVWLSFVEMLSDAAPEPIEDAEAARSRIAELAHTWDQLEPGELLSYLYSHLERSRREEGLEERVRRAVDNIPQSDETRDEVRERASRQSSE